MMSYFINIMTSKLSIREQKKIQTHDQITAVAMDLFAKQGFENTTVDEIVSDINISKRTFFRYFPTKEHVVFQFQAQLHNIFKEILTDIPPDQRVPDAVHEACLKMAQMCMSERKLLARRQLIVRASPALTIRQFEMDAEWETIITEILLSNSGNDRQQRLRTSMIAGALFGLMRAVFYIWFDNGCEDDLVELCRRSYGMVKIDVNDVRPVQTPEAT